MRTPSGPRAVDPVDRAHLTGTGRPSPPIHRYAPSEGLEPLVQRHWVPVWSVSSPSVQSTLQLKVLTEPRATLAGIAAELGYTDQAHFTADFRAVTGTTPGRFLDDQRPAGER